MIITTLPKTFFLPSPDGDETKFLFQTQKCGDNVAIFKVSFFASTFTFQQVFVVIMVVRERP